MQQQMLMAGSLYSVDSADFDGTNDYMLRGAGLTGAADSKTGILSCWLRIDGGDGIDMEIFDGLPAVGSVNPRFSFFKVVTSNVIAIIGQNAVASSILDLRSATAYTASATWLHILASWNLATAATYFYVNDVDDENTITATDDTLDYTLADWSVCSFGDGSSKFNGCLTELYFAPGQFLDFSTVANRRKFIDAYGKPVYLGANGAAPTGTAPLVYQRLFKSQAVAGFATNNATGGDFSITGTLATGSTSPSD